MNGRDNLDELLNVLETIRQEKYPHIPGEVIRSIVSVQFENQDKRPDARIKTTEIVERYLSRAVDSEE